MQLRCLSLKLVEVAPRGTKSLALSTCPAQLSTAMQPKQHSQWWCKQPEAVEADPERKTNYKTRYLLTENNRYFEIDIFPGWKKQAIMELELKSEDEKIVMPEGITIIKEVTDDLEYSNYSMAISMPEE